MTFLKRLRVLPVLLGVAATLVAAGTSLFGDMRPGNDPIKLSDPIRPDGGRLVEELALTKFSKLPALTYQLRDGEMLFAWQVKPAVEAAPARPRDVLVVVDTSASQAGKPLHQARQIVAALSGGLSPNDRLSVWVASTPAATRPLTKGFLPPNAEEVHDAAVSLVETEYGSGATDLKNALSKAMAGIAPARGRQQIVLLLGDGESAFNPISEDDRVKIGAEMDARDVAFFAVPLGLKLNAQNLHGLAAATGGAVVRLQEDLSTHAGRAEFASHLLAAVDTPVVKVDKFKFGDEVAEVFPTKMPPLRADRTTLVMGKFARAAGAVTLSVNGTVAGRPVALNLSEKVPAPRVEHFFLNAMVEQWRGAPHKEAPAMLQSDRALAMASTQVKLYKDEFLVQAVWAVTMSQWDDAAKLYKAAQKLDPNDKEAAAGLAMIDKLKTGKLTRDEIKKKFAEKVEALKINADGVAREVVQEVARQPEPPPAGGAAAPGGIPPGAQDALREAAARRAIEEQRYQVLVDATIRRARQLLRVDPDTAYAELKRQRDEIAAYDALGPAARNQMVADLEAVMREVFLKGAEVKRQAAAEREAIAHTRQKLNEFDRLQDQEARTKNRIDQFRQLMKQARFELAYQEAQLMIQERIVKGQTIPPQAVASYIIGQQATQLREWVELVRIRQDRFLLTMMQTEKSYIPYPDEPPVHFPPAAVWRELTALRQEAYQNSNLGLNPTQAQVQLKSIIENQEVLLEDANLNDIPLFELLQKLSKRYGVTFVIMEEQFRAEQMPDIREKKPTLAATQLRGLKLGTFLDIVLLSMNATYIVRPDYVEITTFNRRLEEKVTRVFPVADLVIPIPSAVNQQTLFQNLFFQNSQLAIFGQVIGQANFIGNNANGNFGGGGAFGGGAPGGFGGGQPGGGAFGGVINQLGNNNGNQGFGAGALGVGGGNLGQFGNLGGQFGLQGGTQEKLLMTLIQETVARGEWVQNRNAAVPFDPNMMEDQPTLPNNQLNSIGYYPPARALIIRGTSRYHPAASIKLKVAEGMAAAPGNPNRGGPVVIGPGGANIPGANAGGNNPGAGKPVAVAPKEPKPKPPEPLVAAGEKPGIINPKEDAVALRKRLGNDPKQMWNKAIDWTVTDPGLIVASAEFLMEMDEYQHAAEVLKGALRKGLTTDAWAHEALAVALEATKQARPEEIERAAVSGIDIDPNDAKAYLKAAKAEAGMKNGAQAVAFCKRAAEVAPEMPEVYANALAYADIDRDVKTDAVAWAARGLLKRDWEKSDGIDYHKEVEKRLPALIGKAAAAGQKADELRKVLNEQTQRDLVIELRWQGPADLDLSVTEPGGSVCSVTQKRTPGGGVLQCDILEQSGESRSEVYTAAMGFKGPYKVSVKQAFGKPIGGTVQVHVWKYKGTPQESYDLLTVPLNNTKPVEIKLDRGSRTELAVVTNEVDEFKAATTGAALTTGPSGFGGGFGPIAAGPDSTSRSNLPVVTPTTVKTLPGIGSSAADLQATVKVNPDRQTLSFHVNPVFGSGKAITIPPVPLIPGGER
jgi:tetratricopeptide (TPR) repeat protein